MNRLNFLHWHDIEESKRDWGRNRVFALSCHSWLWRSRVRFSYSWVAKPRIISEITWFLIFEAFIQFRLASYVTQNASPWSTLSLVGPSCACFAVNVLPNDFDVLNGIWSAPLWAYSVNTPKIQPSSLLLECSSVTLSMRHTCVHYL